eukprot:TRINITY_DN38269_c0_g1_i1.p1 TRINITY_DN38269_c0_g1~~TRINITY_DN38269_c0_g1_i1.p1  ORF type:complete len:256 (-),score=52.68 TRINITY_DN38269_c0_g1_i1:137-904(-)
MDHQHCLKARITALQHPPHGSEQHHRAKHDPAASASSSTQARMRQMSRAYDRRLQLEDRLSDVQRRLRVTDVSDPCKAKALGRVEQLVRTTRAKAMQQQQHDLVERATAEEFRELDRSRFYESIQHRREEGTRQWLQQHEQWKRAITEVERLGSLEIVTPVPVGPASEPFAAWFAHRSDGHGLMTRAFVLESLRCDHELCFLLGTDPFSLPEMSALDVSVQDGSQVDLEGFLEFVKQFAANLSRELERVADNTTN